MVKPIEQQNTSIDLMVRRSLEIICKIYGGKPIVLLSGT